MHLLNKYKHLTALAVVILTAILLGWLSLNPSLTIALIGLWQLSQLALEKRSGTCFEVTSLTPSQVREFEGILLDLKRDLPELKRLKDLPEQIRKLADRNVRAIVTFPWGQASNGLSGEQIKKIAESFFVTNCKIIEGRFSTLGGNLVHRKARLPSNEMVLLLSPQ